MGRRVLPLRFRTSLFIAWAFAAGASLGCLGSSEVRTTSAHGGNAIDPMAVPRTPEECATNPLRDPGYVVLHRLNRAEYNNSMRDLLGDTSAPALEFPADDFGYGFDNIADVLSVAPLLVEKYEAAAEKLVEEAWARDVSSGLPIRVEAETATASVGALSGAAWNLYSNGTLTATVTAESAGSHRLDVRAWAQQMGSESAKMALRVDGQRVGTFDITATSGSPQTVGVDVQLSAGQHTVAAEFLNDAYDGATGADRNLYVDWFELRPPPRLSDSGRLRVCDPAGSDEVTCTRQVLERFTRRAWRRPAQPEELSRLAGLVEVAKAQGDDWAAGVKLALQAVLLSPHFLFRVELDPLPNEAIVHPLNAYELATRLSYFLWSSLPDVELSDLADSGALLDSAVLEAQVRRMLADPKASAFVENFAGQWLYTRAVDDLTPDGTLFPEVDGALKSAMRQETELTFSAFLHEDRPFADVLQTDFTYVNDRLATHYGLALPGTHTPVRVSLPPGGARFGLLTQGALLSVTSQPNRTSPVKRGKWVLAQLLCSEPPPPPANVDADLAAVPLEGTTREKLAVHRTNPTCAGCHQLMDPIGLGLEQYDAVGRYRTTEAGQTIDPAGVLPGGQAFSGAQELGGILRAHEKLPGCVTQKVFTYALGRGDLENQTCTLHDVATRFSTSGRTLGDLLRSVVQSDAFRERRGRGDFP